MAGGVNKSEERRGSPVSADECWKNKDGETEVVPSTSNNDCTDTVERPVWIFGYGSLLWKVNFPYHEKLVGYVEGYSRRFWQGNSDHRGIPGAPGRVVTLIKQNQATTWGIAYQVDPHDVEDVIGYLNHRESGYTTKDVLFHPKASLNKQSFMTLAYIGTEADPMYLGPAPLIDIAKQIVASKGASGCNTEYALNLAKEMRKIAPGVEDRHLFSLEGHIREILREMSARHVQCICQPCGYHRHII